MIGIGILAGAATGGAALGIALSHRDNHRHLTPEEGIKEIYELIHKMPGGDNSNFDDFNHFHDTVINSIVLDIMLQLKA